MSWSLLGVMCGCMFCYVRHPWDLYFKSHPRLASGDFLATFGVHAWLFCWFCPPFFKLMLSRTLLWINQCLFALGVLSATLCIKNSLRLGPDDFLATWGIERGFFSLCKHPARACCLADLLVCLPFNPIRVSVSPPHKTSPSSGQMSDKRDRKFASPHPR